MLGMRVYVLVRAGTSYDRAVREVLETQASENQRSGLVSGLKFQLDPPLLFL